MKKVVIILLLMAMVFVPLVSAGVGISWDKETALIPENTETCLTYGVYNPWPEESYVKIKLSESLDEIVESMDISVEKIPAQTASRDSIPVTFCFQTPIVYEEDCALGPFLCKQECNEEMKIFSGEVEVIEVSKDEFFSTGGAGGSATTMSISAPLKVKVQCIPHSRNYTLVYIIVGLASIIALAIRLTRKKKKLEKKSSTYKKKKIKKKSK